ncbi:MAG: chemotaxis protein, partial [Roseiarcus sp.]
DQMTQRNAAMVEESTAATHTLSQETAQLSDLIAQFRLGEADDEEPRRPRLRAAAPTTKRAA